MDERRGYLLGIAAFGMWGVFPIYFKLLAPSRPVEILAHRIVWSLLIVVALLLVRNRWSWLRGLARQPWRLLGVLLLHERLRAAQWAAIGVGAAAVAVLTVDYGRLPWIALTLAFSFGTYGLVKKRLGLPAAEGLFVETAALTLPALGYLAWLSHSGANTFGTVSTGHTLLLVGAGAITAVPLMCFAGAANRVPLSALGMMQYLAPTLQFAIGVLIFHEPMPPARQAGFLLVWTALAVFTWDALRHYRRRRTVTAPERPAGQPVIEPSELDGAGTVTAVQGVGETGRRLTQPPP